MNQWITQPTAPPQRRAKSYRIEGLPPQYNTPVMRAVRRTLARQQLVGMIAHLTREKTEAIWARAYTATQETPASLDEALLIEYNRALRKAADV